MTKFIGTALATALLGITAGSCVGLSTHSHLIGWVAFAIVVSLVMFAVRRANARRAADDAQAVAEERARQEARGYGPFADKPGMPSYDV